MVEVLAVLEALQPFVYGVLALVVLQRWYRLRDASSGWAAAMFTAMAVAIGASRLVPEDGSGASLWEQKLLIAALVLFPYFLFRFAATFRTPGRVLEVVAAVLAAASVLSIFLFEDLPDDGEDPSTAFAAYTVLVIAYWILLSVVVAAWFWRGGAGRPTVVRRRMRTLAAAVTVLAAALLLAGSGSGEDEDEAGPAQVLVALLAVGAAPLFLVGLAPPASLLQRWRRPEEAALLEAEAGLVAATSPEEVARSLLPYVASTLGGDAAVLSAPDGAVVAAHGIDDAGAAALAAAAAAERTGDAVTVTSISMPSGRLSVAGDRYTPFFGREEGKVLGRLGSLTDVALRRAQVTEAERVTAEELQRANAAMREFVSVASHDLRTPIAVVKGYAATMTAAWDTMPDEDKLTHIETIARQADHLSRLVNDLLTTSQLDVGAVEPYLEVVDLGALVAEVLSDLGRDASVEIGSGTLVCADEDHAGRIVRNLVENATNYGEPPIEISARAAGDTVDLRVRDHGPGVAEAFRPRLFDRFARADTSASKAKHGTGLGLAIVRGLARAGGGDAWYEAALPGARFVVRFRRGDGRG